MTDIEFKKEFEKRVNEYSNWLCGRYDKAKVWEDEVAYHIDYDIVPTVQEANRKLLDLFGKSVFKFGTDYVGDVVYDGIPFDQMWPVDPRERGLYDDYD